VGNGEWAPDGAAHDAPSRRSFRPLIAFWVVLLAACAGGAGFLQLMGPVPPGPVHTAEDVRAMARAAAEAHKPRPPAPPPSAPQPGAIPDPNPSLLEPVPGHPDLRLPKIADGKKAATYYAAKLAPIPPPGFHGRLALVVDGIGDPGLSLQDSLDAIRTLPSSVDMAFSAYAAPHDDSVLAEAARASGHECLVSVPMQPGGSALDHEGDLELRSSDLPDARADKLDRALAHTEGCVGATGASDGKSGELFATYDSAILFDQVVADIHRTGLFYFDPRTRAPSVPDLHVDMVLDRDGSGEPLTDEKIASNWSDFNGLAADQPGIGLISLTSLAGPKKAMSLQEFAAKVKQLYDDGIELVPLSAALAMQAAKPDAKQP
jgi:polysaccharide deacetylase 2 family uncharacterized protein YibQ